MFSFPCGRMKSCYHTQRMHGNQSIKQPIKSLLSSSLISTDKSILSFSLHLCQYRKLNWSRRRCHGHYNSSLTGLLELTACCACTISRKSVSSCLESKLSTKLISADNDNCWQDPSVDKWRFVIVSMFNTFILFTISQLKKILISQDLVSLSCRKAFVSGMFFLTDCGIVDSPSPLSTLVLFFKNMSL